MNYGELIQFDSSGGATGGTLREAVLRLARKTPEQQSLVQEHLSKTTAVEAQQLAEMVELFPFHPTFVAALERIPFIPASDKMRLLAAALKHVLSRPLPANDHGLLAADELWRQIRADTALQAMPDIEAVNYCCAELEKKLARKSTLVADRELPLRVARALAVHRLGSSGIYSHAGATAVELCELLGLRTDAGVEARLQEAITRIHHLSGAQLVSTNPETGRHHLQIKKFKRFVPPELLLHWVNALPFLALMSTGAVMLASRFFNWSHSWIPWVQWMHEVSAETWLLAMPPTIMLRLNVHWRHIRTVLTWGQEDFLWMVQSMRVAYSKQAKTPPAGQLNSGQKMNALLVLFYFFGFGGTGVLMYFKSSILFPWYVHVALFFAAIGTVGGHLFLALINPSTRIALPGIFHGWVPLEYVEHHHPLSLPPSLRSHLHEPSRKTLFEEIAASKAEVIILVITVLLAGVGAVAFGKGRMETAKSQFSKRFSDTISPNQLSTWHRVGPPSESCTKCHAYTGEIPNAKCEACHQDIQERRAKTIGYHGTLKADCRVCHQEHQVDSRYLVPLDRKKFDHRLAIFKLEGRHVAVACDDCHKKPRPPGVKGIYFTGLKFAACTDCHQDLHQGQLAAACEKCHSVQGWQRPNLKFSHNTDTSYKLEGKHQLVECVKCHLPASAGAALGTAKFKNLRTDCPGCHEDPHQEQFAQTCTTCHTPAGWKRATLLFNHNRDSRFPLVAKHAYAACEKCHVPEKPDEKLAASRMHGLKAGCADCHQDPHRGQFKADCTQCHPAPDSWRGKHLHFEHNRDSKFVLAGKHVAVDCAKCHKPQPAGGPLASAQFTGLPTGCEDCHKVKHPADYGQLCLSCHTAKDWTKKKPAVDHPSRNEVNDELLLGKHLTARCDACHNDKKIPSLGYLGTAKYDCVTCHAGEDPHKGTLGNVCYKCHGTEGWKGEALRFNHDTMTTYPLDQDHRKLACNQCHENNHWKLTITTCVSCHPKLRDEVEKKPLQPVKYIAPPGRQRFTPAANAR